MSSAPPSANVHGFVLAGGRSSRMGQDKAELLFAGVPLVQQQRDKLRTFCACVSIVGNRPDLARFAPVVFETRLASGPVAGIEAGLQAVNKAANEPWALFVPVDVPLVPPTVLLHWAESVLRNEARGVRLSFLQAAGERQPAFCLLHRCCAEIVPRAIDEVGLRLGAVFATVAGHLGPGSLWIADAEMFSGSAEPDTVRSWFTNLNTPEEHRAAEAAALSARAAGQWNTGTGEGLTVVEKR